MAKRKIAGIPEDWFGILHLKVVNYSFSTDASINYEARDKRRRFSDTKVFSFASDATLECQRFWPMEYPDWKYRIRVYGNDSEHRNFDHTLSDFQVVDERGSPKYRKRRGISEPVYAVPNGIGFWEKTRGEEELSGPIWVSPKCMTDMMIMLCNLKPLYIDLHEVKVERTRWISGFRIQTEMPE